MKKLNIVGTAIVASVIIAGCGKQEPQAENAPAVETAKADPNETMIEVCGQKLTRGQIDADVEALVAANGANIPADQLEMAKKQCAANIARNFLVQNVLAAKAAKLGFNATEADIAARKEEFMKRIANQPNAPKSFEEFLEKFPFGKDRALKEFTDGIVIDKMLKAEMEKDQTDYSAKAKEQIAEMKKRNEEAAKSEPAALAKIQGFKKLLDDPACTNVVAKFGELAEANSDCPSGKRDKGSLGAFTHGQMVPEFDKVAFSLPIGKVSEPVKTQFGYHLILVTAKTPAVEAKDGKPAEPEKVTASHILIKTDRAVDIPSEEDMVKQLKKRAEYEILPKFVEASIKEAAPKASPEYKQFLPQEENAPAPLDSEAK